MILSIYRSGNPNLEINIAADGIAVFTHSLMGEHKIVVQFSTPEPVDLKKGDYITHEGIKFTLNIPAEIDRSGQRLLKYSCTFESPLYSMYSKVFMNNGAADFDYNGATPTNMVQLLIDNMNEIDPGWTVGEVETGIDIGTQGFTFSNVKCRDAINTIAEQFGLEWNLDNKKVNLVKKVGNDTTLRFAYGKGLGLYQLKRQNVDDKNIVTKLYVFGGTRNIDYQYRDGAKRLQFAEKFLTKNVTLYGLEEGVIQFDDIYPKREGKVTATSDPNTITDSTLDFDINAQLLGGIPAKISFLDGDLAGMTFEIAKNGYDAATKKITFNSFDSDAGLKYPSPDENLIPRVGDTYILLDIKMPATYISAAENLLKQKGQTYLDENSVPRVQYGLTIDPINARKKGIHFNVGDRVNVIDPDLGINEKIRVSAISYPLYNPYQITATIADSVGYTLAQRLIAKQIDNEKQIGYVDQRRSEDYRRGYAQQQQLRDSIFDPSGEYFDPENIRPESIETLMLSVGAKSQAFQLSGAYIKIANDNASFTVTACKLIHNNLEIEGLGYTWVLAPWSQSLTDPAETYYLYALCSKTALVGTWVADPNKVKVDDIAGYYTLLVGVIYPVVDGYRGISLTYGYSSINGRTITAGRIQSLDGQTWWDLDTNQFNIGPSDGNGLDWGVTAPNQLTIRGGIVQRIPGVSAPIPVYRGQWFSAATYFPGDTVKYNGQTYTYIGTQSSSGHLPTDTTYWEISASQGVPGSNGVSSFKSMVFKRSNTKPLTPSGGSYSSPVPSGWSDGTPAGEEIMWMSTRIFTNTGGAPQGNWTEPQSMTDTANIDNAFSSVAIPGIPDTSPQNWHEAADATPDDIWMATRTKSNGVWSEWAIVNTKGEKGDTGNGIQSTKVTYQGSTNGTSIPTGTWVANPPNVPEGQYLWTRTVITYTDGSTSASYSVSKQGESGADGQDGIGITNYQTTYQKSSSGTTAPTGTWTTTIPSVAPNEFLWTRLVLTYSDNTTSTSYSVGMMGQTGAKGQAVFKSQVFKRSNTTPATPTGGSFANPVPSGWSDGIPSGDAIIWASTRILTSDGLAPQQSTWTTPSSTSDTANLDYEFSAVASPGNPTSNPGNWHDGSEATPDDQWMALRTKVNGVWGDWAILKIKGEDGKDGTTILSTVVQYQVSTSGTVIPTGTWLNAVPTVPQGRYLWTRTKINYSNDTTSTGYSVSHMGENGLDGADGNGIVSTVTTYQKGSSGTSIPTGTWVSSPPVTVAGDWIWTRIVITYTDGTHSTSYSTGRHGEKGDPGANAIIGVLTNESHTIPTDVNGNNGNFTGANTKLVIYNGATDDSANWSVTAAKSSGVTGSLSGKTYTVTAMTTDTGYVDLTATRSGYSSVTKRFVLTKAKQGSQGDKGIPGTPGADGKTSYTHIAYADTSSGSGFSQSPTGKAYVGMYVDFTEADSSTPSKYAWSLIKGADGSQGIPGTPGEDGKTPYFHVAYANNSTGTSGFSTTDGTNKKFIGQYTDFTAADSTNPSKYTWTEWKGADATAYWLVNSVSAIAKNAAGTYTPATITITGKSQTGTDSPGNYAGRFVIAESTNGTTFSTKYTSAEDEATYTYTPIAGLKLLRVRLYPGGQVPAIAYLLDEQIIPVVSDGQNGQDGQDGADGNYVEYRFAVNGSPTSAPTISKTSPAPAGWTIQQPSRGLLQYIWMTTATKTAAGALVVNWSTPSLLSGAQGDNGPSLTPRGLWSSTEQYKGNELTVDVVKYTNNQWYIARWDKGNIPVGTLPTNTNYWNSFGANFESIATGVFFAEKATINNLLVQVLETTLKDENDNPVTHIVIDGSQPNPFVMYDSSGNQVMTMNVLAPGTGTAGGAGLRVNSGGSSSVGVSELTTKGIFTNAGNQAIFGFPPGPTSNAGIVSLLFDRNSESNGVSAAVAGIDKTTDSDGVSASYGGYFNSIFGGGMHLGVVAHQDTDGDLYLTDKDTLISIYRNTGVTGSVYLPSDPKPGKFYIIKSIGESTWTLRRQGTKTIIGGGAATDSFGLGSSTRAYEMTFVWFDGSHWVLMRTDFD